MSFSPRYFSYRLFSSVQAKSKPPFQPSRYLKWVAGFIGILALNQYLDDTRAIVYPLVPYLARWFDPEKCHEWAVTAAKFGLLPKERIPTSEALRMNVFDMDFSSPIGLAAGFDKNAAAITPLGQLGFSFIEVGSITPLPQEGNPKPRVFRLAEDDAIINRYGFNSLGVNTVYDNLFQNYIADRSQDMPKRLGLNLGKNKETAGNDAILSDYSRTMEKLAPFADYFVINVSSPNTPGLRDLQNSDHLQHLLQGIINKRDALYKENRILMNTSHKAPPIIVKISPDLDDLQIEDIQNTLKRVNIDGIIVCNTTTSRPESLNSTYKDEIGGLSGKPLADKSLQLTRTFYEAFEGKIPIISVGGVFTAEDVYVRLRNGASLVQIYTALTLKGPGLVTEIKLQLQKLLKENQYRSVEQIIGADTKFPRRQ